MKKFFAVAALCASALNADVIGISMPFQAEFLRTLAPELKTASLLPPGADPHSFEPRASTMAALQKSALYLGLSVESEQLWLPKIRTKNMQIVHTDAGVKKRKYADYAGFSGHHEHGGHGGHEGHGEHGHEHEHGHHEHHHDHDHDHHDHAHHDHHDHHDHHHHGEFDVHIWTSPKNLIVIANASSAAIAQHYPAIAKRQHGRLGELVARLQAADKRIAAKLAGLRVRGFASAHPSWGYFAADYGLAEFSLEFEGQEGSAAAIARIKKLANEGKICLILRAPQFSDKFVKVLQNETLLPVADFDPLAPDIIGELERFADTLVANCK